MEKKLKIAFSGPSGLGKSTLCEFVSELGPAWLSTSAGHILGLGDKEELAASFGYTGSGHRDVINLSSKNPEFGKAFQQLVLERRAEQIHHHNNFVIDRCPIDNVAYMLSQVGHNATHNEMVNFIGQAIHAYSELTHVIQIRFSNDIPAIEDNKSRIASTYFQQYMSDVFMGVYNRYFANVPGPRVITLDFWNLNERKATVRTFLDDHQLKIELDGK